MPLKHAPGMVLQGPGLCLAGILPDLSWSRQVCACRLPCAVLVPICALQISCHCRLALAACSCFVPGAEAHPAGC